MALRSPRFQNKPRVQGAAMNSPPFRRGERSAGVRILQEALCDLGYPMPISTAPNGDLDGIYGAETEAVVRKFQNSAKLSADGIAGAKTMQALDAIFLQNDPYYGESGREMTEGKHFRFH